MPSPAPALPVSRPGPGGGGPVRSEGISPDIITIGASAGGVSALQTLVANLPADFGGAIFVVLHFPSQATSVLHELLGRWGPLGACQAVDGATFEKGRIYVARPDHHLLLEAPDRMRVVRGPRENRARPSIDVLFRSAARAFGPRVIGVVLSGMLCDGTVGLGLIKSVGGIAIVQDPNEAVFSSMPAIALRDVAVDHVLPAAEIAQVLPRLLLEPVPGGDARGQERPEISTMDLELEWGQVSWMRTRNSRKTRSLLPTPAPSVTAPFRDEGLGLRAVPLPRRTCVQWKRRSGRPSA